MLLNFVELIKVQQFISIRASIRGFNSKVPNKPCVPSISSLTSDFEQHDVSIQTIELLERLSLVNFGNVKGVEILKSSIKFAEKLVKLDTTTSVKPLISVLETENLHLRDDFVADGNCRKLVMSNTKVTEEEYFVAPPGNIPLEPQANELFKEKFKMAEALNKVLEVTYKVGYLQKFNIKNGVCSISFGPLAMLLATNIFNEWFHSNVISTDMNVIVYDSHTSNWIKDCQSSYKYSLQLTNNQLPFGLASKLNAHDLTTKSLGTNFHFSPESKAYRKLVFIDPKKSQHYFYRMQNQRKIWWRKFSTDPEKFSVVECQTQESQETVQISAKLPWSSEIVETIHLHRSNILSESSSVFELKSGRKRILPDVIECVGQKGVAVMTHLADALQQCNDRSLLSLHPCLAPYKVALAVSPNDEKIEETSQLAEFLNLNLRKAGLHTLYVIGSKKANELENQFKTNDALGIPYTVVVTGDALVNGIIGLRSRDTTLQEEVHVSKLTSYMKQLLSRPT